MIFDTSFEAVFQLLTGFHAFSLLILLTASNVLLAVIEAIEEFTN